MGLVRPVRRHLASRMVVGTAALAVTSAFALASPASASPNPASAPYLSYQWGLSQIGAPSAWGAGIGSGVRIGIVDTGVDFAHPDLAGKVGAAATCINTNGDPNQCVTGAGAGQDDNGHGTHVAGIAAAAGNGVAGVAPGATFVVAKVLDSSGSGNTADVAAGIEWVVHHGAQVVNLSLGSDTGILGVNCVLTGCSNSTITPAVEDAWKAGVIPVIAAGNNAGNLFGPAGYGNLDAVVVAATGKSGQLASYSSTPGNAKWGVLAPGGDDPNGPSSPTCGMVDDTEILSTFWSGGQNCYATDEGTSMATPFVSGSLALLLGRGLSPQGAVQTMLATLNKSVNCGAGQGCQGLVNAAAAMAATGQQAAPPRPASPGGAPPPSPAGATAATGHGSSATPTSRGAGSGASGSASAPTAAGSNTGSGSSTTPTSHSTDVLSMGGVARSASVRGKGGGSGPWAWLLALLGVGLGAAAFSVWRRYRGVGVHTAAARTASDTPTPAEEQFEVLAHR